MNAIVNMHMSISRFMDCPNQYSDIHTRFIVFASIKKNKILIVWMKQHWQTTLTNVIESEFWFRWKIQKYCENDGRDKNKFSKKRLSFLVLYLSYDDNNSIAIQSSLSQLDYVIEIHNKSSSCMSQVYENSFKLPTGLIAI